MAIRQSVQERGVENTVGATDPAPAQRIGDYLKALRRRWFLVVVVVALSVGSAFVFTARATKQYDAGARVLLERSGPINTLVDPGTAPFSSDPERDINTGVALIKLESVAKSVEAALPFPADASVLLGQVRTDVEGNSDIVRVVVRDESPTRAAAIANEFARQYVAFRQESAKARFQQAARLARTQLRSLSPDEQSSTQGRALRAQLRELEIASALQTGGARVVDEAEPPTAAATPRPFMAAAIAGFLGLAFGVLVALWREFADRRLKEVADVEAVLDVPVLATIPRGPRPVVGASDRQVRLEQESFSTLAVNLRFLKPGEDSPFLMVTSPAAKDGKTVVTLRLAGALAALGHRVLAIEADLRHPSFARYLDLPKGPGLAMVLAGISDLATELVSIDATTLERNTSASSAENASFLILPAGRTVPNPHGVLASDGMRQVLAEAYSHADIILIDTPPMGVVSDAAGLADIVSSCLVVLRLNRTTRDEARRTVRAVQTVGIDVSGLVMTGARPDFQHYHYYSD